MNKILFILFVLLVSAFQFAVLAKDKDRPAVILPRNAEGKVQYQEAIDIPGATASMLFSRAKKWGALAFGSVKDTLQNEDASVGILIFKGYYNVSCKSFSLETQNPVWVTLSIEVKDSKARITLIDFVIGNPGQLQMTMESCVGKYGKKSWYQEFISNFDARTKTMIEDIKKALAKQEENW